MPPKKKKSDNEIFFLTFVGEFVIMMTKLKTTTSSHTEEGSVEETNMATFDGYLLDVDDSFFYIGANGMEVSKAIRKDQVVYIEIIRPKDQYDGLLDNMKTNDDKDFN